MFWMLLPPSANAGRHIEHEMLPHRGAWSELLHAGWDKFLDLLLGPKSGR